MRKSAAPSQLGPSAKRAKFVTPFRNTTGTPESLAASTSGKTVQTNHYSSTSISSKVPSNINLIKSYQNPPQKNSPVPEPKHGRSTKDVLRLIQEKKQVQEIPFDGKDVELNRKTHAISSVTAEERTPLNENRTMCGSNKLPSRPATNSNGLNRNPLHDSIGIGLGKSSPDENVTSKSVSKSFKNRQHSKTVQSTESAVSGELQCSYFSVLWCKLSKKKHKKWEGDAILIAKGRSVSLVDMEGKEIGKGTGYKSSELTSLEEGQSLSIGGKEIEIMGLITEENYKSGKCFQTLANQESTVVTTAVKSAVAKPFQKPNKLQCGLTKNLKEESVAKPRFNPLAAGAVVLPKPNQVHQWEHNTTQLPVVDVVVDPYLSVHLRPHQIQGIVFLYECIMGMKSQSGQGAILADEMGLGKTLQCISLIWTLLKQGPYGGKAGIKKVIVITPGSLVKNWCREFKKWLGNERLRVFAVGQNSKPEEFVQTSNYPVMVVSYEMFVRCYEVIKGIKFDLLVCDEGHRLKNTNIKTTSLISSLVTRKRIILTGTPVQNDLKELFSIVDFCNPGILGTSSSFKHVYEDPLLISRQPRASAEEVTLGETRATELNRITSMFILRRTSFINNKYLPPKVELVLFCGASELQLSLYQKLLSSRIVKSCLMSHGTMDMAQHLMCISALKKLCNHPMLIHKNALGADETSEGCSEDKRGQLYGDLLQCYPQNYASEELVIEDSGKLTVLANLLASLYKAQPRERVVLVSNYTQTLDLFEELCKRTGYGYLRLDGQTPTGKRQQLVESFNSPYCQKFVFLLSSKAGGVGLNLIGASYLILYDIDWNPANDLQAMARVWRDGQQRKVFIYRLLTTGSIEEKMYQRQITKQSLSGVVVDSKANSKLNFSQEELKDLFRLQEGTLCATHDLLGCSCNGKTASPSKAEEKSVGRSCQLQTVGGLSNKKKNVCMDELLEWNHMEGPSPPLDQIDHNLTCEAMDQVTYAFWIESNKAQENLPTSE